MFKKKAKVKTYESRLSLNVKIKNAHRSGLPFSLKSRNGVAIVFSFYGDSEKVGIFMQKASHKTRAYYVNANGLKGFIVRNALFRDLEN